MATTEAGHADGFRDGSDPAMSAGSIAEQLAALRNCEASLQHVAALLTTLAYRNESANGAVRALQIVESLNQVLTHEFPALVAERAFHQLLATDNWTHPTQAIDGPFPDWELLLRFCDERLEATESEERARLEVVRRKLVRAVRIAAAAKKTRQRRRQQAAKLERRRRR